jgi:uncharacterized membrane protein
MARNTIEPTSNEFVAWLVAIGLILIAFVIASIIAVAIQFLTQQSIDFFVVWHYESAYHGIWYGVLFMLIVWVFFLKKPRIKKT